MRLLSKLSTLFCLPFILSACSSGALILANGLASLDDYETHKNIAYGPLAEQHLDLYLPSSEKDKGAIKRPVILFLYGGCWGACLKHKKADYAFIAQAFTSLGYAVVIPDYRHYPNVLFPSMMADVAMATNWINQNAKSYDIDTDQVILSGHSAGAHMAALLTLDETYLPQSAYRSIKGFIGFAGPYDFLPFTEDYQPTLFGPEQNYPKSQPVNYVSGNEAPMLLLYGNSDRSVYPVNIESLTRVAQEAGSDIESHRYDGISHSGIIAALSRPLRERKPVMADIVQFLERVAPITH